MSHLFSPGKLGSLTLDNRIVVAPMCQYSAIDGDMTDWHLMHLGQYAVGGAGLVLIEASGVEAEGRITPGCPGLYNDANEASMARVIRSVPSFWERRSTKKSMGRPVWTQAATERMKMVSHRLPAWSHSSPRPVVHTSRVRISVWMAALRARSKTVLDR